MAQIEIDTTKLKECGQNVMDLAIDIGEDFTQLFDRIKKMPYSTGEWVGPAAERYATNVGNEKALYMQVKDIIYSMGKFLFDNATEIESKINKY